MSVSRVAVTTQLPAPVDVTVERDTVHGPETFEYDKAPEPEPPVATNGIDCPNTIELEDVSDKVA